MTTTCTNAMGFMNGKNQGPSKQPPRASAGARSPQIPGALAGGHVSPPSLVRKAAAAARGPMDTPSSQHPVAIEVYNTFLEYRQSKPPGSALVGRAESLPPRFPQMIAESPDLQAAAAAFMANSPEFQAAVAAYARSPALSAAAAAAAHPSVKSPLQAHLAPGDPSYLIRSPLSQVAETEVLDSPKLSDRVSIPPTPDIGYSSATAMYGGFGPRMPMMPPPPTYLATGSSALNSGLSLPPPSHTPLVPSAFASGQSPPPPTDSPVLAEPPRSNNLLKMACSMNGGSLSDAASAFDDLAFWSQTGNEVKNETLHEGSAENSEDGEGEGPGGEMPPQPSAGSRQHGNGKCKPCAFYHKKGCDAGVDCTFCHMCEAGEKKRRRQLQRFTIKQRRMRREARLAEEAKERGEEAGDGEEGAGGASSPSKSEAPASVPDDSAAH